MAARPGSRTIPEHTLFDEDGNLVPIADPDQSKDSRSLSTATAVLRSSRTSRSTTATTGTTTIPNSLHIPRNSFAFYQAYLDTHSLLYDMPTLHLHLLVVE